MDSAKHPLEKMMADSAPETKQKINPETKIERTEADPAPQKKPEPPGEIELTNPIPPSPPAIDLSGIDRPALLLDDQMTIVWQNPEALEKIWHMPDVGGSEKACVSIFDLIFDPVFKSRLANLSHLLDFFLAQIMALTPRDRLLKQIETMDEKRKSALLPLVTPSGEGSNETGTSPARYLHQMFKSGVMLSFEVFAANFAEGRLLVFESCKWDAGLGDMWQEKKPAPLKEDKAEAMPVPVKMPFVLLVGRMSKAATLRDQMLASEYCRLVSDVSQLCMNKVESYGGKFGKHIESGFFAYFLPNADDRHDPMRAVECALEIKERLTDIGREWKIRKEWSHGIELNMGLHWEEAFVGTVRTPEGDLTTSFGDGLQIAGTMSQLAGDGQIWATKAMIHQLPTASRQRLRFGILRSGNQRHQSFMRNGFDRLRDALNAGKAGPALEEAISLLPITEIFDLSGSIVK